MATAVNSSISEPSLLSLSRSDVSTTKQSPSKVDDAFSMCGKFFFLPILFAFDPGKNLRIGWRHFRRKHFYEFAFFVEQVFLEIPFDF